jgi:hypothetical protein
MCSGRLGIHTPENVLNNNDSCWEPQRLMIKETRKRMQSREESRG